MSAEEDRIFTITDGTQLYIRDPSSDDRTTAEMHRAKTHAYMLQNGCLLRHETLKILEDKGIWSQDKEAEAARLTQEMEDLLDKLDRGGISISQARDHALRVHDIRNALQVLFAERISYLSESVEAKARNAEFNYLVSVSVVYNDNRTKKFFDSYDDYLARRETIDASIAAQKCSEILYGLADFDDTPEKNFLKKYKFVDDNLRLINSDGHLIDREGRLVDEDGNLIKYVGRGEKRRAVIIDENGQEIKEEGPKPFLDDKGKPIEIE